MVIDSFGCTSDTTVEITNSASTLVLTLGSDLEIQLGDSVFLEALVGDPSEILSVHWNPEVICDSCLSNTVSPLHTAIYSIVVEDVSGCLAEDEVTIIVDERPKYFIPSVFSPNGDEINDFLQVYAHPGIERIQRFTIYDRWGNAVYHKTDFDPADQSVGWDGTFDGKKLDPAVFVYLLEVKLITGRLETNHGNVTLVK
jgi:gliding motility-associated-like protein